jgi:hypothetical protein
LHPYTEKEKPRAEQVGRGVLSLSVGLRYGVRLRE